jgi:hypothetical protein
MHRARARSAETSLSHKGFAALGRRGVLSRTGLLLGTALGCSLAIAAAGAPGAAWAANDCGPLTTVGTLDSATCTAAANPYPAGITYTDADGLDLLVILKGAEVSAPIVVSNASAGEYAKLQGALGYVNDVNVTATSPTAITLSSAYYGAVDISGNVSASATGVSPAHGIAVNTGGESSIAVAGTLSVSGARGETGIVDTSGRNAVVYVGADINVHDFYGGQIQGVVVSTPSDYQAYVTLKGNVTVRGQSKTNAIGLNETSGQSNAIVYGALNVTGDYYSTGAKLTGDSMVSASFDSIIAFAYRGPATGIKAVTNDGLAIVDVYRDVGVEGGSAVGISTTGSYEATTHVYGNISVTAFYTTAVGVDSEVTAGGLNVVRVGGDVLVTGGTSATGIDAQGGNITIHVGDDVAIATETGPAIGITATTGAGSYTGIEVDHDVSVSSIDGNATGITVDSGGSPSIVVGGNVTVGGAYAVGVFSHTDGAINQVVVDGTVHVAGTTEATGLDVVGGYADVYAGNVVVKGAIAYGVELHSAAAYATTLDIGGNLSVYATTGNAFGAVLTANDRGQKLNVGGDVSVTSADGAAFGVSVGTDDLASVVKTYVGGDVTVTGENGARAIAASGGLEYIDVRGNITAHSQNSDAYGVIVSGQIADTIVGGSVNVYTHQFGAYGLSSETSGYSTVSVGGAVYAKSASFKAIGVESRVGGAYLNYVHVGGDVTAIGPDQAYGVEALGGDVRVDLGGNVTAIAVSGEAVGVLVKGDAYIHVAGNVSAYSKTGDATGISEISAGYAGVHVGGYVYAATHDGNATGVYVESNGGAPTQTVVGVGVTANSYGGEAVGVEDLSSGDAFLQVGGVVYAGSHFGDAKGIYVTAGSNQGDYSATVIVGGGVVAKAGDVAYGVEATSGNVTTVNVLGNLYVASYSASATGIYAFGGNATDVFVGGGVTVFGSDTAVGVNAQADGAITVKVAGDVYVNGYHSAKGVYAYAPFGTALVYAGVAGNVTTYSAAGNSSAMTAFGYGNVTVHVGGDVRATTPDGYAYGVNAGGGSGSPYVTTVFVGGNVTASGSQGAYGVRAERGDVEVHVGGDVNAQSLYGNANGVYAKGDVRAYAYVGGSVSAYSKYGNATGVSSVSAAGYAGLHVKGDVYAGSKYGYAQGVVVAGSGAVGAYVGGNITVKAADFGVGADAITLGGPATVTIKGGVNVYSANYEAIGINTLAQASTIYVGGDIHVSTPQGKGAYGVYAEALGTYSYVTVKGNVTAVAPYGYAVGVISSVLGGAYKNTVYVGGNITVSGHYGAEGVKSVGEGYSSVIVGGSVRATSDERAVGIDVNTPGSAYVKVGGDVIALADDGDAFGVHLYNGANLLTDTGTVVVGGNVTAYSKGGAATGIYADVDGRASVTVTGNVYAGTPYGVAKGVDVSPGGYAGNVTVGGNVTAIGAAGAVGVYVDTLVYAEVRVGGVVGASSSAGNATGIESYAVFYALAAAGGVTAYSKTGKATGVNISAETVYTDVKGDISVHAPHGYAVGVYSTGAAGFSNYVAVTGNVTAVGATGATGVYVHNGSDAARTGGAATAVTTGGEAVGVKVIGDAYAFVGGNVTAYSKSGTARGVYLQSTDYAGVHVKGDVYAGSDLSDAQGLSVSSGASAEAIVYVGGNVTAVSKTEFAESVFVESFGNVSVTVGGDVTAQALNDRAYALVSVSETYGGAFTNTVTVGGDVKAIASAGATGVYAGGGQASVSVGGNVSAMTTSGAAFGVKTGSAYSKIVTYNTNVTVIGNVTAYSHDGNAAGVHAVAYGYANVSVGGNVLATSVEGHAYGVYAQASGNVGVDVTGNAVANTSIGRAEGVYVVAQGSAVDVTVGGRAQGVSKYGQAYGVNVEALSASANVTVGGAYAYSHYGLATGLRVAGDVVHITAKGDVYAKSHYGEAIGINGGGGAVYVTTTGNVTAVSRYDEAIGVLADATNTVTVKVGGSADAISRYSAAYGVDARSTLGNAYASVGGAYAYSRINQAVGVYVTGATAGAGSSGDIEAKSHYGAATGVSVQATGEAYTNLQGNVTAVSLGVATGVEAKGTSALVDETGQVAASSSGSNAFGVKASATTYSSVKVGSAYAYSKSHDAYGVYANQTGAIYTGSTGDVFAKGGDRAYGVFDKSYGGNVTVNIGGNAVAEAKNTAAGVFTYVTGDASVTVHGTAEGVSSAGFAAGVIVEATGNVTVDVGGVYALGVTDALGVRAYALNPTSDTSVTIGAGGVLVKSSANANGVRARGDDVTVSGPGGVTAIAQSGFVEAVYVDAFHDGTINLSGNVVAAVVGGGYDAIGVYIHAARDVNVHVGGNVAAYGYNAVGVVFNGGADANVTVGGAITAVADSEAISVHGTTGGGNATVTVDGPILAEGEEAFGVLVGTGGNVSVDVGNVTVNTTGATSNFHSAGVSVYTGAYAHVVAGTVITTGGYTDGVRVGSPFTGLARSGSGAVDVYAAETLGVKSDGVYMNVYGNASVTAHTIYTAGADSIGVRANSLNGGVDVTTTMVETKGYGATGISAVAGGPVVVNSGTMVTFGNHADGIYAANAGTTPTDTVSVTAGYTYTHGDDSIGIYAKGFEATSVTSTLVKTLGDHATGISAISLDGPVGVTSGTVETSGYDSAGIQAVSTYGNVSVTSTDVFTYGDSAAGIQVLSTSGVVDVTSTQVVTSGLRSDGIHAESGVGDIAIISGLVETSGNYSDGVFAYAFGGNVSVTSNAVMTSGTAADGVRALASAGDVSLTSTYAKTSGYGSIGLYANASGNVSVTSGTVLTSGAFASGVFAASTFGDVDVDSQYVKTTGAQSYGVTAVGGGAATVTSKTVITSGNYGDGLFASSDLGVASITSQYVRTSGDHAAGIVANGYVGATVTSATVFTSGAYAPGIQAVSYGGNASVVSAFVRTYGDYANAITAAGTTGAYVHNTNAVITSGYESDGISASTHDGNAVVVSKMVVTYGDEATGISAFSAYGDADVTSTMVYTAGAHAAGISAVSEYGNVTVNSGQVVTKGNFSPGIYTYAELSIGGAAGITTITSGQVFTYGHNSLGIEGVGYNGLKIYSGEVITRGDYSKGIFAVNYIGDVLVKTTGVTATYGVASDAIYAQNFLTGNVTVDAEGAVYAKDGVGVHVDAIGGHAVIDNAHDIYGGRGGIVAYSTGGTTINNAVGATIGGAHGYAIGVSGAGSDIENHGRIYGYAHLSAGADIVNNSGAWFAYGVTSFGSGTDTVNNTGSILVASFSATPTTTVWSGLEVFNNSGLVDLRNGHTGDVFDLGTAAFTGSGASTLGLDASLSTALSSDKLVIGAAAGKTMLAITDVSLSSIGTVNLTGTVVVDATSGTASNFTWAGRHKGFIDYELQFFAGPVTWNIVALPDKAAFEMLKAPQMAQDFWRHTGDAWSAREQEVRDSLWGPTPTRGEGWEMWAQAQAGGENQTHAESFDVGGMSFTPNLSTASDWRGFQMGGDNRTAGNWLWGFTGGFLEQNTRFRADHNSFDTTGWNVGAYAGYTSGRFFLNGLVKGDWFDLKANMVSAPSLETSSGNSWGAKAETGFRFGGAGFYLEPMADLAWNSTHLDDAGFKALDTTFTFGTATSLRGSVGARLGGSWGSILPYVGLYAVQEFDEKNRVTMLTGSGCPSCFSLTDTRPGAYERADFGFTTTSWNGLEGFLQGDAEFGGHTDGFTGRVGVRWSW